MDPALAIEVASLAKQRALNEAIEKGDSEIQNFYKGASIFVTGGSGFIGKQLIEKLFRSCQINKAFILLRPKKGKTVNERLQDILKDPAYDIVHKKYPDLLQRLVPVTGDVTEIRLGLCDDDWNQIVNEVNVIIHVAATVNFQEHIKLATLTNVRGTREVIHLGYACKNMRAMVHVSTAFSHATLSRAKGEVAEKFYQSPITPSALIEMAETMDGDRLYNMTPHLIGDWPNTYTFTKAVAEEAVRTMGGDLPICVVRPSVVIGSYREPYPGWLDPGCAYGPSGLILGVGLGIMRVLLGVPDNRVDLVPVDLVTNAIVAAGARAGERGRNLEKIVYTVCSIRNQVTWGEVVSFQDKVSKPNYPTARSVYYPWFVNATTKLQYLVLSFFLQIVPGFIADLGAMALGKSFRLGRLYKTAERLTLALSDFTCNNWKFLDNNLTDLYKSMSETDKIIFNCDIQTIDMKELFLLWAIGVRKYIVKDGLKDTEYAKKKLMYLKFVNIIVVALYIYLWYKVLMTGFSVIRFLFGL